MPHRTRTLVLAAVLAALLLPVPALAAPVASRSTEADAREASLATVQDVLAREEIAGALAARGLTKAEIDARLAGLSDQDLASLARNLDQVQAAGRMDRDTMWIVIYILLGVLLIILLV